MFPSLKSDLSLILSAFIYTIFILIIYYIIHFTLSLKMNYEIGISRNHLTHACITPIQQLYLNKSKCSKQEVLIKTKADIFKSVFIIKSNKKGYTCILFSVKGSRIKEGPRVLESSKKGNESMRWVSMS